LNTDLPSALQSWADDLSINATVRNYGDEGHDLYDSDGIQAKGKAGDASIRVHIDDEEEPVYPRISCEVGYSEDDDSLLDDAERWLLQTDGEVLCVILIKFTRPPNDSNFMDVSEWRATLRVYER